MRYKQVFRCAGCGRRRWREVEAHPCVPAPTIERLQAGAWCSACGCRTITVRQYKLMARTADQTFPGGMRFCLIGLGQCVERDRDVRAGIERYEAKWGQRFVHPHDPEFGWVPALEALLPTLAHNAGVAFLKLREAVRHRLPEHGAVNADAMPQ